MFTIFMNKNIPNFPVTTPPIYDYFERTLLVEYKHIMSYYQHRENYVPNTDIFVRMIKWFNLDMSTSIYDYVADIDALENSFYRHFKIASPVAYGTVRDPYTFMSTSIYMDYFNLPPIDRRLVVKPLLSFDIDYTMPHPTDRPVRSIIGIDPYVLMLSYREWYLYRISTGQDTNVAKFVFQYIC